MKQGWMKGQAFVGLPSEYAAKKKHSTIPVAIVWYAYSHLKYSWFNFYFTSHLSQVHHSFDEARSDEDQAFVGLPSEYAAKKHSTILMATAW